ncbi:MAG: response regulator transcription factor [Roseiflexaceae bacterium]
MTLTSPVNYLLVVEDRFNVRMMMSEYLTQQQFDVTTASNGVEALEHCQQRQFDCILLDLMMPTMNGIDFLRELRKTTTTPVIVISAKLEESDKISAFEHGADEYITKPVSMRELTARINALLRRVAIQSNKQAVNIQLSNNGRTVFVQNRTIDLTPTEFKILEALVLQPNKILSRKEIGMALYGTATVNIDRSIDVHIRNIRSKIEVDAENPVYITTVYGAGYRFQS